MATIAKSAIQAKAREMALEKFGISVSPDAYQTDVGSFDVLVPVEIEDKSFEVAVTIKATAHDYLGTDSRPPYDMFEAHEEFKAVMADRAAKAKAREEKKAADAKARAEKAAARAAKSKSKTEG